MIIIIDLPDQHPCTHHAKTFAFSTRVHHLEAGKLSCLIDPSLTRGMRHLLHWEKAPRTRRDGSTLIIDATTARTLHHPQALRAAGEAVEPQAAPTVLSVREGRIRWRG